MRHAVESLAASRLIRIEHGRGSFVAETVLDYRIGMRPRFSEWIRRHNREPAGQILELRELRLAELLDAAAVGETSASPPTMIACCSSAWA